MATQHTAFIGARLSQAREARGLTAARLAELVGVTPAAISQYENDEHCPRHEILEQLCGKLGVQLSFFRCPMPTYAKNPIFYRSMSAATKSARTTAERRYEWLQEIYSYLAEQIQFPAANLPATDLPVDYSRITQDHIEQIADTCRAAWRLPAGPLPNIVHLLESNGIIIGKGALDADTLDAFSEYTTFHVPFIFLGADKNVAVRSRFDALHELGHLIMHRHVDKKSIRSTLEFKTIEDQAHYFAAAVQLPRNEFLRDLWAPSLDCFIALKEKWKVAVGTMIKRCVSLGIIDEEDSKRLWINKTRRGYGRGKSEPLDDVLPVEQPRLLASSIRLLVDQGIKTKEQISNELHVPANDIEELTSLPKGYFAENSFNLVLMPTLKPRDVS